MKNETEVKKKKKIGKSALNTKTFFFLIMIYETWKVSYLCKHVWVFPKSYNIRKILINYRIEPHCAPK